MVGKILKSIRMNSGYSQVQLSKIVNIPQATISSYETDSYKPSFETVVRIAKACEYDLVFIDRNSAEQIPVNLEHVE